MATLQTIIVLRVGEAEAEYAATVTYDRLSGYDGDRFSPPEQVRCEVTGITLDFTKTRRIPLDDLIVAEMADGLQPELMTAWADDLADAEERRAEQRRDDQMMERL